MKNTICLIYILYNKTLKKKRKCMFSRKLYFLLP